MELVQPFKAVCLACLVQSSQYIRDIAYITDIREITMTTIIMI